MSRTTLYVRHRRQTAPRGLLKVVPSKAAIRPSAGGRTPSRTSSSSAEIVLAAIRTIFALPGAVAVAEQIDEIVEKPRFPVAAVILGVVTDEATAFTAFPVRHWKKIWSTSPLERVNMEIKRRTEEVA